MAKVDPNNRNADLDEGLPARMFSGIVTGAQDAHRRKLEEQQKAARSED